MFFFTIYNYRYPTFTTNSCTEELLQMISFFFFAIALYEDELVCGWVGVWHRALWGGFIVLKKENVLVIKDKTEEIIIFVLIFKKITVGNVRQNMLMRNR